VLDQAPERIDRGTTFDVHAALALANLPVGAREHRAVQIVLAFEVVVDLALGRAAGNLIDARAGQRRVAGQLGAPDGNGPGKPRGARGDRAEDRWMAAPRTADNKET